MKNKTLCMAVAASFFSLNALAEGDASRSPWLVGASYTNFSESEDGVDLSFGILSASVGYRIEMSDTFALVPEFKYGVGVKDESYSGVYEELGVAVDISATAEISSFSAFSLRGELALNEQIYLFAVPTYARVEMDISADYTAVDTNTGFAIEGSESDSDSSWEFGLGAGAGYRFSEAIAVEALFQNFDGTSAFTTGLNFSF